MKQGVNPGIYAIMGILSSVCVYLSDSVKCLVFSRGNEQECEVSDVPVGVFPGGEFSDLFLSACPRI